MATAKPTNNSSPQRVPKVRIARPANRPFQLRYTDPETKKEILLSIGTRDECEAQRQKQKLEARLLLGIEAKSKKKIRGPQMTWEDFREEYSTIQLASMREKSAIDSESRLDIAENIVNPKTLSDLADADTLKRLQSEMLLGAESRKKRPRSPHTVNGYMAVVASTSRLVN